MSIKVVLKQLHADLIGKDAYRGVTLSYAWLANQLGHFTLGFLPPYLYHIIYFNVTGKIVPTHAYKISAIVALVWLLSKFTTS